LPPEKLVVRHLRIEEAMPLIAKRLLQMYEDGDPGPLRVDVGPNEGTDRRDVWPLKQAVMTRFNS
jgi:hypothetical protein